MLKKVAQRPKRVISLSWLFVFFAITLLVAYVLSPYMNISLILNAMPFLSFTSGNPPLFYGENVDMSQVLPGSQRYVVNSKGEDLIDIAADLGINFIRITNAQRSFNNNADSIYTKEQWDKVLNKMQHKGIKALILIETSSQTTNYYTPDIRPIYLDLVQRYIDSGVFSHTDVYGVDIKNEPILTDANVSMLRAIHDMIKLKYPNLKQTVGWWGTAKSPKDPYNPNNYNWSDFSAGQKLANIVDFYSIHMYELSSSKFGVNLSPDLKAKVFISKVEDSLHTKKPILIGEFGEANGDAVSDQDTVGSPELQANVYQGVYQALREMRSSQLIGSVAFDFYSRNQYPDAWAIVKNHGDYLLPAASVLKEYASGKTSVSLPTEIVVHSQSYLANNADNYTTKNLYVSDRIGLKLQLINNVRYSLTLSTNSVLKPVEVFHYEAASNSYYAVYQATSKGNVQINIIPSSDCITDTVCTLPAYTLTVSVQ